MSRPRPAPVATARGEVLLVEYDRQRRPDRVVTRLDGAVVEWTLTRSERDGCTYVEGPDDCGPSPDAAVSSLVRTGRPRRLLWSAEGAPLRRWSAASLREAAPVPSTYPVTLGGLGALGWRRLKHGPLAPDPFAGAVDLARNSLVYCAVCRDHMDDADENLCVHLFWSDALGATVGPGADDYSGADALPSGLRRLIRRVGCARHLLAVLSARRFGELLVRGPDLRMSVSARIGGVHFDGGLYRAGQAVSLSPVGDADLREGFLWLRSIDAGTVELNRALVAWLRTEVAAQGVLRSSGLRHYWVRDGWEAPDRSRVRTLRVPFGVALAIARKWREKGRQYVRVVRLVPAGSDARRVGRRG